MNKKRMVGIGIVLGIIVVIIALGIGIPKWQRAAEPVAEVLAEDGSRIAGIRYQDGALSYECTQEQIPYVSTVVEETINIIMEQEGCERAVAENRLVEEGFRVTTPYRQDLQEILQETVDAADVRDGSTAIVLNDIHGRVLACYCSSMENPDANYCLASTYAGSTMKPISVYAPAIEDGTVTPLSMVMDEPYKTMTAADGTEVLWPKNTAAYREEPVTVAEAIQKSLNTIAVRTLKEYGVQKSCDFLESNLGVDLSEERTLIAEKGEDEVLGNIALGYLRDGVTPYNMAGYYQIFANGGMYTPSHAVLKIEKGSEVYYRNDETAVRVLSENTAYICNRLLKLVTQEGGTAIGAAVEGRDICGKTGTTDDFKDNWFIGTTPDYVCAVWYGGSENAMEELEHKQAVTLFRDVISETGPDQNQYEVPNGVREIIICEKSGKIAGDACRNTLCVYVDKNMEIEACDQCGHPVSTIRTIKNMVKYISYN